MVPSLATAVGRDLQVADGVRADAVALVETANDRRATQFTVALNDGQTLPLTPELSRFLADMLEMVASGATLTTASMPEELSSTVAAQLLGVSRPTLMKFVARGEVPAHKVGSHTRLRRDDVLALRDRRRRARSRAVDELLAAGEAFD